MIRAVMCTLYYVFLYRKKSCKLCTCYGMSDVKDVKNTFHLFVSLGQALAQFPCYIFAMYNFYYNLQINACNQMVVV
jgi:hypothetical protein